jgi:hypothetical protein
VPCQPQQRPATSEEFPPGRVITPPGDRAEEGFTLTALHCDDVVRSPRSIRTVSSNVRVARYALRRTPPANVSMPPANVSTKGSPVTASSAMPSELVAQDARVLVVIQGVGCQPEPSSMPYIGQVMMIFGGGLAEEASAISAEPWKASAASRVSHTSTTRYPPSIGPPAWNSAPAGDPDSLTFLTTNSYCSRVRSGISARIAKAMATTTFSLGPMVFAVGS